MAFEERYLRTHAPVEVAGRTVKRYDVTMGDLKIDDELREAAMAFLPSLLPTEPDATPPATFIVLHRGESGAFLNAYSWAWDNVIHCRTSAAGVPFLGCADDDVTHFSEIRQPFIGCVWELPALAHERSAWVRHMLVPERPDLGGYLADVLPDGPTGGP